MDFHTRAAYFMLMSFYVTQEPDNDYYSLTLSNCQGFSEKSFCTKHNCLSTVDKRRDIIFFVHIRPDNISFLCYFYTISFFTVRTLSVSARHFAIASPRCRGKL